LSDKCALSLRSLDIFDARWRAGTLLAPSAEETAYFQLIDRDPLTRPAELYITCAQQALATWLPCALPAEDAPRLRAVYGALRAALALDGAQLAWLEPERVVVRHSVADLARAALDAAGAHCVGALARQLHAQLHAADALSQAEQGALRALTRSFDAAVAAGDAASYADARGAVQEERRRCAAADAARHGLRACAAPKCGKKEAHAKEFKVCGRCRGVAYCCAAHQQADWRRHKREDGCTAAA
jgi:hypothetical protein